MTPLQIHGAYKKAQFFALFEFVKAYLLHSEVSRHSTFVLDPFLIIRANSILNITLGVALGQLEAPYQTCIFRCTDKLWEPSFEACKFSPGWCKYSRVVKSKSLGSEPGLHG